MTPIKYKDGWFEILKHVPLFDRQTKVSRVCKLFHEIVNDPYFDQDRYLHKFPTKLIDAVGGEQKFLAIKTLPAAPMPTDALFAPKRGAATPFLCFSTLRKVGQDIFKKTYLLKPSSDPQKDWIVLYRKDHENLQIGLSDEFLDYIRRLFAHEHCGVFILKRNQETPRKYSDGSSATILINRRD